MLTSFSCAVSALIMDLLALATFVAAFDYCSILNISVRVSYFD